jgi:predicted SnoaL-like aldol condensation-catalyzing enzyme
MTTNHVKLAHDYLEQVWNQGRTDRAADYLAEDLIQHNPNLPDGRKPLVEFIEGLRQQVPDGRFEIRRSAAEGDLVFVHSLFTTGPEDRGTAVVDIFRIADGAIVEHWDLRESVPENTVSGHEIV